MKSISLKPAEIIDAETLFPVFNDEETVRFTNFKHFHNIDMFREFLQRFLQINLNGPLQYGPYCIYRDEKIIGLCGLQQKDIEKGSSELWYILNKNYWGQGYAKIAVLLLLKKCFENKQLYSVFAEAVTSNISSWKILEATGFTLLTHIKNGFTKEGVTEDLRCYSLSVIA